MLIYGQIKTQIRKKKVSNANVEYINQSVKIKIDLHTYNMSLFNIYSVVN